MTLEEALAGKDFPDIVRRDLVIVDVPYLSFDAEDRIGQLIVHRDLVEDVRSIFSRLREMQFPISQMTPVAAYGWDDDASMAANNSSAFNYRLIAGTDRLSSHSYGRAIDLNPLQNPYTRLDGVVVPQGARYETTEPGTVTDAVATIFEQCGWEWGGRWKNGTDWQHFQKIAVSCESNLM